MQRDQIILKLEQHLQGLHNVIKAYKTSENSELSQLELALFENKLITFYDEIIKIRSGENLKFESKVEIEDKTENTAVNQIDIENEPTVVSDIKAQFESLKQQFDAKDAEPTEPFIQFEIQNEAPEEQIDKEIEHLIDTATDELKTNDTPKQEPELESNIEELPKTPIQKEPENEAKTAEKIKEPVQSNESIQNTQTNAGKTKDNEAKPTSLNERLKKGQSAQTSLLDKLTSSKTKTGSTKQISGKPIRDLKKAINLNLQIRFQRELFENEKRAYRRAIDFINKCNTYSEARSYIQHELAQEFKNCKEGNPSFDEFMSLVKRRFI
ncbi:MAG: hypothetical protein ACPGLV_16260 [Bacteroidia bacterium]